MNKPLLYLIGKRILYSVFLLFLLTSFIFILLRLSPGNPAGKYISPELNPLLAEKIKDSFGLNLSIPQQYWAFITQTIRGDLGISFNYRMPVTEVITRFLPFTVIFALICFSLQTIIALLLSFYAAERRGSLFDRLISKTGLFIYSLPSFLTGVILILLFSEVIKIFPSSGLSSFHQSGGFIGQIWDNFKHLVLPTITLTMSGVVIMYWYLRENMDEVFNSDYVLYLKVNGISRKEIIKNHILPNAISPLISVAGIELGILLSGALVTEVIFGLPGMGRLTVQAILMRDYPLVTGCALVSGVLVIGSNFIADILKYKIDKRLLGKGILD